ncbi:MAG: hypothetical protein ACKOCH_03200, partial [Bacteroidota bacterium]
DKASNIAGDFTGEDLIWHYIEFGTIPVVAPNVTQERLMEAFLNLATKYPVLVLSRLREIFKRRPWILSRLSLQCSAGYLAQLLFALYGIQIKGMGGGKVTRTAIAAELAYKLTARQHIMKVGNALTKAGMMPKG